MTPRPGRKRNRKEKGENQENKKMHKQNRKETVKKSSDNDNKTKKSNDENMQAHGSKNDDYLSEESDQTTSSDNDDTDPQPDLRNRNLEKLVEGLVNKKIHEMHEKPFECPRKGRCMCCDHYKNGSNNNRRGSSMGGKFAGSNSTGTLNTYRGTGRGGHRGPYRGSYRGRGGLYGNFDNRSDGYFDTYN